MPRIKSRLSNVQILLITLALLVLSGLISIRLGAVADLGWPEIRDLRMPRVLLSMVIGAALAVSGTVLQALFRNPLCDPYTLGVSSGAGLGAVIGLTLGLSQNWLSSSTSAFVGSLGFTSILLALSTSSRVSMNLLLLTGVMLGFLGSGLISLWMVLTDPGGLLGALQWLLGDLSRVQFDFLLPIFLSTSSLIWFLWRKHRVLDVMLLGDEDARSLGLDIETQRRSIILLCAFLIGLSVSSVGMIGFMGLIVPHLARKWVGSLHRFLIPQAALLGAVFLVWSDLASRMILRPLEIPVGILTAILGAPFFVWILLKEESSR